MQLPDHSINLTEHDQHGDRQTYESSFSVGMVCAQSAWASNAERRTACLTDYQPYRTDVRHSPVNPLVEGRLRPRRTYRR
jgi:hypothetical protein